MPQPLFLYLRELGVRQHGVESLQHQPGVPVPQLRCPIGRSVHHTPTSPFLALLRYRGSTPVVVELNSEIDIYHIIVEFRLA